MKVAVPSLVVRMEYASVWNSTLETDTTVRVSDSSNAWTLIDTQEGNFDKKHKKLDIWMSGKHDHSLKG